MAFPVNMALYLQHLSETKSSKSAVEKAKNVAWAHSVAGIRHQLPQPWYNPP